MASVPPLSPHFLWLHMNRPATLDSYFYCITFDWSAHDISHKNQEPLCPQPFHLMGCFILHLLHNFQTPGIQRWLVHRSSLPGLYWLTSNSRHGNIMKHAWFTQWQSTIRTQYELKITGDRFRFPRRWRGMPVVTAQWPEIRILGARGLNTHNRERDAMSSLWKVTTLSVTEKIKFT